jgi:adenylate cyclase
MMLRRFNKVLATYSFATIGVFILALLLACLFMIESQNNALRRDRLNVGTVLLNHFVNMAATPLLKNDALTLNTLLREARSVEGLLYAVVVDQKGIVRAHTDPTNLGASFGTFTSVTERTAEGNVASVTYSLPNGEETIDLSRPVTFMKKDLGTIHVGLSVSHLNSQMRKENLLWLRNFLPLGLALLLVPVGIVIVMNMRLRQELGRTIPEAEPALDRTGGASSASSGRVNMREGLNTAVGEPDTPSEPGDETLRNQVTVLFAGVKGFKAYARTRDAQEVLKDLNEYFDLASQCIARHGGYIDKLVGDAIIGVFGTSPLLGDHSERAVHAAMAMQEALRASGKGRNPLFSRVGIGISSGVVLSGAIGSEMKKEHTFIGESFKVAYSLNVMAGPGEIVISKEVYQSVEDRVSVEPLPPREMMHRTNPWENFRLLGIAERKDAHQGASH